MVVKNFAKFRS